MALKRVKFQDPSDKNLKEKGFDHNNAPDNDHGATMLEYAFLTLILLTISIALIVFIGRETSTTFSTVGSAFDKDKAP